MEPNSEANQLYERQLYRMAKKRALELPPDDESSVEPCINTLGRRRCAGVTLLAPVDVDAVLRLRPECREAGDKAYSILITW